MIWGINTTLPTCNECNLRRGRDNRTINAEKKLCNCCCVILYPEEYGKWALAILNKMKAQYPERFENSLKIIGQRRNSKEFVWW